MIALLAAALRASQDHQRWPELSVVHRGTKLPWCLPPPARGNAREFETDRPGGWRRGNRRCRALTSSTKHSDEARLTQPFGGKLEALN